MPWHFHETLRPIAAGEVFRLRPWQDVFEALWERQYAMRESNLTATPAPGCILNRVDTANHALNANPFPSDVPASPSDTSGSSDAYLSLRYLQEWCENNLGNFVESVDAYGGMTSPTLPAWRRCTQAPFVYDSPGKIEAGDIIGPWLFYDIQEALNLLVRWQVPNWALNLSNYGSRSANGYTTATESAQAAAASAWNSGNVYEYQDSYYWSSYIYNQFWYELQDGYSNTYYTYGAAGIYCFMGRLQCSIPAAQQLGKVELYIRPHPLAHYGNRQVNGGMLGSDPQYFSDVFAGFTPQTMSLFDGSGWDVLAGVQMVDYPPTSSNLYDTQEVGWQFDVTDVLLVVDAASEEAPETGFAYTDRSVDTSNW